MCLRCVTLRAVPVFGLLAAGAAVVAGLPPRAEEREFRALLVRQFARYPLMRPQDVYKLVFQATMGSRHSGLDSAMAARWLDVEMAGLGPDAGEPVVDTISPDGRMARVNLRPYFACGGGRRPLLAAFLRTAREHEGSRESLRRRLEYAERTAGEGSIPLPRAELRGYFEVMRSRGYPLVEHSDEYLDAYRPAYRVVLSSLVPQVRGAMLGPACGGAGARTIPSRPS